MPTYAQPQGWRHFWLRRIHSLLGIMFGGYVAVHLIVNATGFWPRIYQMNVDKIHALEPMLPLIEILFIFLPLLVHLVYGIYISFAGVSYPTTGHYGFGGNIRYVLQRLSAIILIFFVLYHIVTLHKWGFGQFDAANRAYQTTVQALKTPYASTAANAAIWVFYLLGVWAATFHFANGLWTAAITWGLTTTESAQRRWGKFCCAVGIGLTVFGTAAWVAFTAAGRTDVPSEKGVPGSTWTMQHEEAERVHRYKAGEGGTMQPLTQPGNH